MDTTTIPAAHYAIMDALRSRFNDRVAWYGLYEPIDPMTDEGVPVIQAPALLLELESDGYVGTEDPAGRLAVDCVWIVHCVLTARTERLQIVIRQFAAAVASIVLPRDGAGLPRRGNRWGLGAAADWPTNVAAQPGRFSPGLNGFDERIVRWEQRIYIDEEIPL